MRQLLEIVPTEAGHLTEFLKRVREEDRREATAASGLPMRYSLAWGIEASRPTSWTALYKGEPQVVGGALPHPNDPTGTGIVWLLGTDFIEKNPKLFHRGALEYLGKLHEVFPRLTNFVDCRNAVHLLWLRRLGFRFIKLHQEWGPFGLPFIEFERMRRYSHL